MPIFPASVKNRTIYTLRSCISSPTETQNVFMQMLFLRVKIQLYGRKIIFFENGIGLPVSMKSERLTGQII